MFSSQEKLLCMIININWTYAHFSIFTSLSCTPETHIILNVSYILIKSTKWKQAKSSLTDEWVSKMLNTLWIFFGSKTSKVLIHDTTWKILKFFYDKQKKPITKNNISYHSVYVMPRKRKSIETVWLMVPRTGVGNQESS